MKLHIKDLHSIKITKAKDWVIHFECDDQKYMIHEDCLIYEPRNGLYKKKILPNGRYELELMQSLYGRHPIDLIGRYKGKHPVYSQINKVDFVTRLVHRGFATNDYPLVNFKLAQNTYYKEKADSLEARAREYRHKMII